MCWYYQDEQMTSSTGETQDEHQHHRWYYYKSTRKYAHSKTRKRSKDSSSAIFQDQEMGDGENAPFATVSEQPPIRFPAPFETEDLAFNSQNNCAVVI
jgi:hypothetical protein